MGVRLAVRSRAGQKVPGELEFAFDQSRIVIGRGGAADICLPHRTVSEAHATVQLRGDDWWLADTGSTNGTKLNGQRLIGDRARKLRDADLVELGAYLLSFHVVPLVIEPMSAERTAELARRLLRETHFAPAERLAAPRLCVLTGPATGTTLEIPAAPCRLLLGHAESAQLSLPDPGLAAEHAEVIHDLDGILIRNLGHQPGMVVGEHVVQSRRLRDGDEVLIGSTRLLFEDPAQASLDALRGEPDLPVVDQPSSVEATEVLAPPELHAPTLAPVSRAKPGGVDADMMIYALAAAVLVMSVLGLVLLLRAH